MSFHWIIIVFGIVSIANVESQCQGKGYKKFEEVKGHCFFEPPDADYREKINVETKGVAGPENCVFNMDNARKVCKSHGAEVLQWDTNIPGNETDAIFKLRAKLDGNVNIPVPCYEKGVNNSDCYSEVDKTPEGIEKYYFINSKTGKTEQSSGEYYGKKDWDGLICHHQPKETSTGEECRPTMAAFVPFLAMLIAVANP